MLGKGFHFVQAVALEERNESAQEGLKQRLDLCVLGRRQRVEGADDIASEAVKNHIKHLVAQEDPKSPYSDQKIVELLKAQGIEIARRTVAKYREVLGILPSSKRKKYF